MTSPDGNFNRCHPSKSSRCSIVELSPTISDRADRFLDGVVSLLWPYSSYTGCMAILLAEADFRIRRAKGQTKITFRGASAVAVASSRLGIGDTVHLNLDAAQWVPPDEPVVISGKQADWDLEYSENVLMHVSRDGNPYTVVKHSGDSGRYGKLQDKVTNGKPRSSEKRLDIIRGAWPSPVFAKHPSKLRGSLPLYSSSSPVELPGSPIARPSKRAKFLRESDSWLYVEKILSSDNEDGVPHNERPVCSLSEDAEPLSADPREEREARDEEIAIESTSKTINSPLTHSCSTKAPEDRSQDHRLEDITSTSPALEKKTQSSPGRTNDRSEVEIEQESAKSEACAPGPVILSSSESKARQMQTAGLPDPSAMSNDGDTEVTVTNDLAYSLDHHAGLRVSADSTLNVITSEVEVDAIPPRDGPEYNITQLAANVNTDEDNTTISQGPAAVFPSASSWEILTQPDDIEKDLMSMAVNAGVNAVASDELLSASRSSIFQFLNDSPVEPLPHPLANISSDSVSESASQVQPYGSVRSASFDIAYEHPPPDQSFSELTDQTYSLLESNSRAEALLVERSLVEQTNKRGNALHHLMDSAGVFVREEDFDPPFSSPPSPIDKGEMARATVYAEQTRHGMSAAGSTKPYRAYYDGVHEDDGGLTAGVSNSSVIEVERENLPQTPNGIAPDMATGLSQLGEAHLLSRDEREGGSSERDSAASQASLINQTKPPESLFTARRDDRRFLQRSEAIWDDALAADQEPADMITDTEKEESDHPIENTVGSKHFRDQMNTRCLSQPGKHGGKEIVEVSTAPEQPPLEPLEQRIPLVAQFATPENTQTEPESSQIEIPQQSAELLWPRSELPLTPQATQKTLDDEATETGQDAEVVGIARSGSRSQLEQSTEAEEILPQPSLLRRSPRLSRSMSFLDKHRSTSLSPPPDPKTPSQDKLSRSVVSPQNLSGRRTGPLERCVEIVIPSAPSTSVPSKALEPDAEASAPTSPSQKDDRRVKGLRTAHSYYTPCASIPDHFHSTVDVLAVVKTAPTKPRRAKSGPRDFYISLKIADTSGREALSTRIFRPKQSALPSCQRGDVLLLRDMKVQTRRISSGQSMDLPIKSIDGMTLLSTESSAWAVFEFSTRYPASNSETSVSNDATPRVQINGPPVEFSAEETAFAEQLHDWWLHMGANAFPDLSAKTRNQAVAAAAAIESDKERIAQDKGDSEHLHEHELRDGMAYGDILSPMPLHEHSRGGTHGHRHSRSHSRSEISVTATAEERGGALHQHRLRDGTSYSDVNSGSNTNVTSKHGRRRHPHPKPQSDHRLRTDTPTRSSKTTASAATNEEVVGVGFGVVVVVAIDDDANADKNDGGGGGGGGEKNNDTDRDGNGDQEDASATDMTTSRRPSHLHEHELRDGMAYGDTISPRPIHEHHVEGSY